MRNKKSLLGLGILVLVLVLGVGYAVVTSTDLSVSGSAKTLTTDSEIAVSFEGTVTNDKASFVNIDGTKATKGSKTATIAVKDLSRIGDSVTVTYKIQNTEADLAAVLGTPTVKIDNAAASSNDYFKVTVSYPSGTSLAAGSVTTMAVKVELIKSPTVAQTATIELGLTASVVAQ